VPFKTGYGLTEAGPNTFWLPEEDVQRKPGAVGHPLFHIDVEIVDPERETPCGPERGRRAAHPRAARVRRVLAESGGDGDDFPAHQGRPPYGPAWLHTGDLARCDAEGYYYYRWAVART
jgi:fatty-acyl-CoA synthase